MGHPDFAAIGSVLWVVAHLPLVLTYVIPVSVCVYARFRVALFVCIVAVGSGIGLYLTENPWASTVRDVAAITGAIVALRLCGGDPPPLGGRGRAD